MTETDTEIREVVDRRDLGTFIEVPWSVYRGDPCWIPPLKWERREAFSDKNPFFRHARWKAWTAWRNGLPVGRISAQVDELYLRRQDARTGFFGLIEAPDDPAVFRALFGAAENWLRGQGMTAALGPFNLGINQEIGCLVSGFDTPPFIMMGHARPYYDGRILEQGYRAEQDLLAYEVDAESFGLPESLRRLLGRLSGKISVRVVDRRKTAEELAIMRDIFNDAWSENWGFVEFTQDEFQAVGKELFLIVPKDFIWIAEANGDPAAFIVLLPNLNAAIADLDGRLLPLGWLKLLWRMKVRLPTTGRVALMGVRRRYQQTRLGPALAFATIKALEAPARRRGIERVEMSWILEQNQGIRNVIEKIGGRVSKHYRMYRKGLD